jgi:hypothetical protein
MADACEQQQMYRGNQGGSARMESCSSMAVEDGRSERRMGSYSAWLWKVKSDSARSKLFASTTKRYFTIDFDREIFFYSHAADQKKISQPIHFRDIICVDQLPPPARSLMRRSLKCVAVTRSSKRHDHRFMLRTRNRVFELHCPSDDEISRWVSALNDAMAAVNSKRQHNPNEVRVTVLDAVAEETTSRISPPMKNSPQRTTPKAKGPSIGCSKMTPPSAASASQSVEFSLSGCSPKSNALHFAKLANTPEWGVASPEAVQITAPAKEKADAVQIATPPKEAATSSERHEIQTTAQPKEESASSEQSKENPHTRRALQELDDDCSDLEKPSVPVEENAEVPATGECLVEENVTIANDGAPSNSKEAPSSRQEVCDVTCKADAAADATEIGTEKEQLQDEAPAITNAAPSVRSDDESWTSSVELVQPRVDVEQLQDEAPAITNAVPSVRSDDQSRTGSMEPKQPRVDVEIDADASVESACAEAKQQANNTELDVQGPPPCVEAQKASVEQESPRVDAGGEPAKHCFDESKLQAIPTYVVHCWLRKPINTTLYLQWGSNGGLALVMLTKITQTHGLFWEMIAHRQVPTSSVYCSMRLRSLTQLAIWQASQHRAKLSGASLVCRSFQSRNFVMDTKLVSWLRAQIANSRGGTSTLSSTLPTQKVLRITC